jgi:hypothetical protein
MANCKEDYDDDNCCEGCTAQGGEEHPCPYDEDVNGREVMCNCCTNCTNDCAEDI